ncbi:hypothetical protein KSP39_PZI003498 [Platanthera zijinensis]|uniref:Uncharacterized protein n=1 Tax=Platanthera zijinensis TaxID=2320716 RepID=A0AAP0BUX6_9ASPA
MELPLKSSPYVRPESLEDYKMAGYGTQGHQTPIDRPSHGGGTDAPTTSGDDSAATGEHAPALNPINNQGGNP